MDISHKSPPKKYERVMEFIQVKGITTIREAADAELGSYRNLQRAFADLAKAGFIVGVEQNERLKKFYKVVL